MVLDALPADKRQSTLTSLGRLMGLGDNVADDRVEQAIRNGTLVRKIEHFDVERIQWNNAMTLGATHDEGYTFKVAKRQMPQHIPPNWTVSDLDDKQVLVHCQGDLAVLTQDLRPSKVTSAGQLPTGFDPAALYASRSHPRGLQMTVYGASDALRSTGFSIDELKNMVRPDQLAVYSGSAMGQLDQDGYGGLMQNAFTGKRPTAKNLALGLPEMPGDFVNAYVLGSVGETAGIIGACATFLYNVKRGMDEIRSGSKRIVIVGNAEAPITPGSHRGLPHHGRPNRRRSTDGTGQQRYSGQPPGLPSILQQCRLHLSGIFGLDRTDGRCVSHRERRAYFRFCGRCLCKCRWL
jgi:acetoacetyl-[acyl-carrier protein] synthase